MGKVWGGLLLVTGIIACPCHLIVTLPLLLGLLAGTAAGALLGANTGLVYGIAGAYFIVALASGWYVLSRKKSSQNQTRRPPAKARSS